MVWKISESGHGGVVASYGNPVAGGTELGCKPGVTMPGFIVYYSCRFATKKQAEQYINKNPKPLLYKNILTVSSMEV